MLESLFLLFSLGYLSWIILFMAMVAGVMVYVICKTVFMFLWIYFKALWLRYTQGEEKLNEYRERVRAGKVF